MSFSNNEILNRIRFSSKNIDPKDYDFSNFQSMKFINSVIMERYLAKNFQDLEFVIDYKKINTGLYVKYSTSATKKEIPNEINWYKRIDSLNITPKLVDYDVLTDFKLGNYEGKFVDRYLWYMAIETWGISLHDKYIGKDNDDYLGPGGATNFFIREPDLFDDEYFPDLIPKNIKSQVWDILMILYDNGIENNDIHTGNFVEKDGIVKMIDLEHFEYVKEKAVPNKTLEDVITYTGPKVKYLIKNFNRGARDFNKAFSYIIEEDIIQSYGVDENYKELIDFFLDYGKGSFDSRKFIDILRKSEDPLQREIADYMKSR